MITLWLGDCLEKMKDIPDESVDMVLTDPPYGTTACKWDIVIQFEPMWIELRRIIKDRGAICLFSTQPFTSRLICSALGIFRYCWVWDKCGASNFLNAKLEPLRKTEDINIFSFSSCNPMSKAKMTYYPQGIIKVNKARKNIVSVGGAVGRAGAIGLRFGAVYSQEYTNYPTNILRYSKVMGGVHPTQKPVPLLEYLIKTYTLEGEMVLDFTMGSGSTGVACKNLNRSFIGIEKDAEYFEIAKKRIINTHAQF